MNLKRAFAILLACLLIFATGCSLADFLPTQQQQQPNPADPAQQTADVQTLVAQIVYSTQVAQTLSAQQEADNYASQTDVANQVAQTLAAVATATPQFDFTPTLTKTPLFTVGPAVTQVTVSADTN